jgi:hypothetical protein
LMRFLSAARLRALLPVCPPVGWRAFVAFGLVVAAAAMLLDRGVSGGVLPAVLGAMAVLTVVLAGGGAGVGDARAAAAGGGAA